MKTSVIAIGTVLEVAITAFASTRAHASCGDQIVVVFDADWCPFCKKVKALLTHHGIPFRSVDVTNNSRARALMMERFGTDIIPVTVIDNEHVVGFDEQRLRGILCLR